MQPLGLVAFQPKHPLVSEASLGENVVSTAVTNLSPFQAVRDVERIAEKARAGSMVSRIIFHADSMHGTTA